VRGSRFIARRAQVASNRRGGEQQAEAGCARDWVDSSGKQDSGRQSSAGEGTWRSYGSSGERQKKGLAQNQPQDPVGPRAQGHANPDFARSPADHAGHESKQADAGQDEGGGCKERGEQRGRARLEHTVRKRHDRH
jgi:hypothetical protein